MARSGLGARSGFVLRSGIFQQRLTHRFSHQMTNGPFFTKLNLAFLRMNIHVHRGRIDFEKEAAHRIAAFHQSGVIAFDEGKTQPTILDWPLVYKEVLIISSAP